MGDLLAGSMTPKAHEPANCLTTDLHPSLVGETVQATPYLALGSLHQLIDHGVYTPDGLGVTQYHDIGC